MKYIDDLFTSYNWRVIENNKKLFAFTNFCSSLRMSVRGSSSSSKSTKSLRSSRKLSSRMDSEVVDAFKLFDRDKDGRVTREEIVDLIESLEGDSHCPHVQVRWKVWLLKTTHNLLIKFLQMILILLKFNYIGTFKGLRWKW